MNIIDEFDTITAIATPLGMGGVGVIRISGDKAFEIIKQIFSNPSFEPRKFNHGWVIDGDIKIDEVIVLPFFAPNSYTGEDVVEIQCHGGMNVVRNILNLVLSKGARMAEKGEFTKRAFLNKRMDLSQAEAVADIIHSKTSEFAKISVKNLSGTLKERISNIRNDIFEVLSKITAGIDFPEDVREPEYTYLVDCFEKILSQINSTLEGAHVSNIFRQGISVAIVGKPNVGKSSLFNALLSLDRAIVTDIAGTTRDVIKETLDLGIPVTLIDTAGIRDGKEINKVEEIGIEYSKQSVGEADLVLFVYDLSQGMQKEDKEILELIKDKNYIIIGNKCELALTRDEEIVYVSALNGEGIEELKQRLTKSVCDIEPESLEFVTNSRQQVCLERAKASIEQALLAAKLNELQDLISIDVKSAILALDEITGELMTDSILDNIFENFCIGK
jgi:tRNA modification GTPase